MKTKIRPNAIVLLDTEGNRWSFDCVTFKGATVTGHYTMHDGRHESVQFPFYMVATILPRKYHTEEYRSAPDPDAIWRSEEPRVISGIFARMNCDIDRTPIESTTPQ